MNFEAIGLPQRKQRKRRRNQREETAEAKGTNHGHCITSNGSDQVQKMIVTTGAMMDVDGKEKKVDDRTGEIKETKANTDTSASNDNSDIGGSCNTNGNANENSHDSSKYNNVDNDDNDDNDNNNNNNSNSTNDNYDNNDRSDNDGGRKTKDSTTHATHPVDVRLVGDVNRPIHYEYLDHTADIQLHGWGDSLEEALEETTICMFGYMTDLEDVDIDPNCTCVLEASGHDNMSLLFSLLDECLFYFSTEDIIFRDVRIIYFDRENFKIKVRCFGETFDIRNKHNQGTEIKAITYSAMQIYDIGDERLIGRGNIDRAEVYCIVDI